MRFFARTARLGAVAAALTGLLAAAACGGSNNGNQSASTKPVGVSLITKDSTNPLFVATQKGAKADATKSNVDLTIASGKADGDEQGQVQAIENAIAKGQK